MFIIKVLPYFLLFSLTLSVQSQTDKTVHKHEQWDALTKKHVTEKGFVNYKGFIKDSTELNAYLELLAANHPRESWTDTQKKAYWINAYNAFTIQLIIRNYPVKSIKDLGGSIYRVNTPWDIKFIHLGDETYDLNNLEHSILRKKWDDARVHAELNCAAVSCPGLRQGAFTADELDEQMDEQMHRFVNDQSKNIITADQAKVSSLFKWYSGDFKDNAPSVIDYINQYSDIKINANAEITYQDYNWNLNEVE